MKPKPVHHARPDQRGQERGERVREDQDDAVAVAEAHTGVVEHQREQQTEEERGRDRDQGEREGPERHRDERTADGGVGDSAHEVVETDRRLPSGEELLSAFGCERTVTRVGVDDPCGGVGDRVCSLVVLERRDVEVALLPVGSAQAALVGVVAERDGELLQLLRQREHGGEGKRGPPVDRDGLVTFELRFDLCERLLRRAEECIAGVRVCRQQAVGAELLDHGDGVRRRVLDPFLRRCEERGDRLVLGSVVAGAVVREADVPGVEQREDLEHDQEDDAGRQVLRRDALAGEVDVVDQDRDDDHDAEDQPLLVREQHERGVQGDRIDDRQQEDLQQHPADRP